MKNRAGVNTRLVDGSIMVKPTMESIAAILYFSNFVLSAIAVGLAVLLFRRRRDVGWLLLAGAFSSPFAFLLTRLATGHQLLTYRVNGPVVDGLAQVTYRWDFPWFYLLVVAALSLLMRGSRRESQA